MFTLIDLSKIYFKTIVKKRVPPKRRGKFVQIINHSKSCEYLVLSPKELSVYHANVVERFCLLNGKIKGSYNTKKDSFKLNDSDWEVIGGGLWAIDEKEKTLSFGGESQSYGKFLDVDLKENIKASKGWSSFIVTIDE